MEIKESKTFIRNKIKKAREQIDISVFRNYSNEIMKRCIEIPELVISKTIHIYVSAVNNEVDTSGIILHLLDIKKIVVVPKMVPGERQLLNLKIDSLNNLKKNKFGIFEPEFSEDHFISSDKIDLVIAPLLAFDRKGGRLGFGGGFYDHLLKNCKCPKIGLAFSFQEIDVVPQEPHDIKLDIILTEKELIRINNV